MSKFVTSSLASMKVYQGNKSILFKTLFLSKENLWRAPRPHWTAWTTWTARTHRMLGLVGTVWCMNNIMCWKIRVRIASARNVCDSEHSRVQFHCTGWFISVEFPLCLFFISLLFYSSSINSLHSMYVCYPFASRAHRGQTRSHCFSYCDAYFNIMSLEYLDWPDCVEQGECSKTGSHCPDQNLFY